MGLAVCCRTEQWRLPRNCFYDLLHTYHRAPNGCVEVSMELLVYWPGLCSRKNLSSFVGTGSLLVHNTLERNIKKITGFKHQCSPETAQDFRPQEIQYIPLQLTSNIYILNICWFNPYPTAFLYGNGMVLHFYQQQESSTTKTVLKVINKGLKTYV